MSLQWYIVTLFLYGEVAFISLLLLPIIPANRWKQLFESRIATKIFRSKKSHLIFKCVIAILVVLLADAVYDIWKYEEREDELHHLTPTDLISQFRAQRNLYIAGTSLFLCFVMNRLVILIISTGDVIDEKRQEQKFSRDLMKQVEELQKAVPLPSAPPAPGKGKAE